LKNKLQTLMI